MIKYREGYKYQLAEDYSIKTKITGYNIDTQFIKLGIDGSLLIRSGYAWDGPSGPTKDDKYNMEGSLIHDALYQLLRSGLLPAKLRLEADQAMIDICKSKGMWKIRQNYYYFFLRKFASFASNPKNKKKIYVIK